MKKQLVLGMFAFFAMAGTAMAQEAQQAPQGQQQMKTPAERAKETVLKLQTDLGIGNENGGKLMDIFTNYYTAQQKAFEDMRAAGGNVDREAMRANREKLAGERDVQLKAILTADQYTKWKDVIEPSMRPQRGQRGGGN